MKRKGIWILAAIAVALAAVIIVLLISSDEGGRFFAGEGEEDFAQQLFRDTAEGFLSPRELERMMSEGPSAQAIYEHYRAYSQYPPHSRPLNGQMKDLLDPWKVRNVPLPIIDDPQFRTEAAFRQWIEAERARGKSDAEIEAEIKRRGENLPRFEFDLTRAVITENEGLEANLRVLDSSGGALSGTTVLGAEILSDVSTGLRALGSGDVSANGEGQYRISWKPPSADKLYWGSLTLQVRLRAPGLQNEARIEQVFFSSPTAPARFTGQFSERLEGGSLFIDIGLDVQRECRYSIHGNLFSVAEDAPTHWAAAEVTLRPGRQVATLEFYGKIFHDGGHEGRFQLRDIRGTCENLPFPPSWLGDPSKIEAIQNAEPKNEPLVLYIPYSNARYTTREYSLDQFTDQEWISPDKERRLQQLRADAEGGG